MQRQRLRLPADNRPQRANQPHLVPGRVQHRVQQIGRGGLAIGAGNANHHQLPAGEPLPRCRQPGRGQRGISHLQVRDGRRQAEAQRPGRVLAQDQAGPTGEGLGDVGMAIAAGTDAGNKTSPRPDRPGVFHQARQGHIWPIIGRRLGQRCPGHRLVPGVQQLP